MLENSCLMKVYFTRGNGKLQGWLIRLYPYQNDNGYMDDQSQI